MSIHCYVSENFSFQRIHIQLCKHPSILPVNVLLGSSQVLKHMIFYAPPTHTHTPSNAMMRFAEEHYKFFVIASLSCLAVVSSVYSCHNTTISVMYKSVCVCLFGMVIWNEKIVYFYWYLAPNKNNTTVSCPLWVFDILYRSISILAILGS